MTEETAQLLFAIEAALPFVQAHVGTKTCSSSGGPAALKSILENYNWDTERWKWIPFSKGMNTEVYREPVNPNQLKQEIDDVFVFNRPMTQENAASCARVQNACKVLADIIVQEVPEGRERIVCVNNLLSTALFASHGITRRQVMLVAASPLPESPVADSPAPASDSTSPASPSQSESAAT